MLNSCIEIFKKVAKDDVNQYILDHYIPANGTYIMLKENGQDFVEKAVYEVKVDKKTGLTNLSDHEKNLVAAVDYPSQLIDTNKALGQKIILSNNYLSFFVKKENVTNGKLNQDIIDKYYTILLDPYIKYKSKNDKQLYESVEKMAGKVNQENVKKIKKWIESNIFSLPYNLEGKDYLKLFFECEGVDINLEGERYTVPNFFNKNDYNTVVEDEILGLPNENLGLNGKKPYLSNKQRKYKVPQLVEVSKALERKKFFDYLWAEVCRGKNYFYFDAEKIKIYAFQRDELKESSFAVESGFFAYIRKDKNEAAFEEMDIISGYSKNLRQIFEYKNILDLSDEKIQKKGYGKSYSKIKMLEIINSEIYSNYLMNQFFTEPKDIAPRNQALLKERILNDRISIFAWAYKGQNLQIKKVLLNACYFMLLQSIETRHWEKSQHLFNLYISLQEYFKGGKEEMADVMLQIRNELREKINLKEYKSIENDKTYFYAVGQLISYFISLNKGNKKSHVLLNPFLNLSSDALLKEKLRGLFLKYNYAIETNSMRFNNLYKMITAFVPTQEMNKDYLIAGYISNSLIYEKREEEE